jgi:hypothetical protein
MLQKQPLPALRLSYFFFPSATLRLPFGQVHPQPLHHPAQQARGQAQPRGQPNRPVRM